MCLSGQKPHSLKLTEKTTRVQPAALLIPACLHIMFILGENITGNHSDGETWRRTNKTKKTDVSQLSGYHEGRPLCFFQHF